MLRAVMGLSGLLLCFTAALSTPPVPAVFKRDIAEVSYVLYGGTWYSITFNFKSRFYTCPNPNDEHGSWTGEVDSWDAASSTLVFKEAYVTCKPDDLPKAGPTSLVKMKFFRCLKTNVLKASTEGGSWYRYEVTFQ